MSAKKKKKKGKKVFEAEDIRRNPWLLGIAMTPLFAILPLLVTAVVVHPAFAMFIPHLSALGGFLTYWMWRRNPWARRRNVRVEVDDETLSIGDKRIPRSVLTRGVAVPRANGMDVQLAKRGIDIELGLEDEEQAKKLLAALGFDTHQTVARFLGMSRMQTSTMRQLAVSFGGVFGVGLVAALAAALAPGFGAAVLILGFVAVIGALLMPSRVEVGADGVLIRWLGRERFISHADIRDVASGAEGWGRGRRMLVKLELASGELYVIPTGIPFMDAGKAAALTTRILHARDAFTRGEDAAPQALLVRGGRSHAQWVSLLRSRELVSHRTADVPKDNLWRVIEDAGAEPIERAAAAVALGKDLTNDERKRLERAARATAAPKLRVVLEKAGEADEDELASELEELEAEGGAAPKKRSAR